MRFFKFSAIVAASFVTIGMASPSRITAVPAAPVAATETEFPPSTLSPVGGLTEAQGIHSLVFLITLCSLSYPVTTEAPQSAPTETFFPPSVLTPVSCLVGC
ncbi:hypothetical protein BDP27DRAFT_1311345 [Rhodocollybia butyracea]|uniref:Uncharacterized protein n=1 Tax=Rhodocollybia butyracea TaxID=206335 RepID=A0A9P5UET2_9AGAR|nr:hypothetical protein BDP27DRAFT_1311345 [Rhodocollybia butyracea]